MNDVSEPQVQHGSLWWRVPIWIAWTNLTLIGVCYVLINTYQYNGEKSSHYLHTDVGFFQGQVLSLQQEYQLFPKSNENFSEHYKYHCFDAHVKFWLAKLLGLNGAFLSFSIAAFIAIVWLISRKAALLIAVPVIFFAQKVKGYPFDLGVSMLSESFVFDSDFINNHNNILGIIILLMWTRFESPWFRYPTAFLVPFIEMTLVPALAGLVILDYALYRNKRVDKALILALIIGSSFLFKASGLEVGIGLVVPDLRILWLSYRDSWWFLAILVTFFLYLRSKSDRVRWFDATLILGLLLFPTLEESAHILAAPVEWQYYSQDSWQIYQWVFLGVSVYCLSRIGTFRAALPIIGLTFTPMMLLSIVYFGSMSIALANRDFHRMSEHLDNRELIEVTKNIDNDGIVGLNFIDNPLRERRQLQVVGLIPNQLFVSNLVYGKSPAETKAQLCQDWEDIQRFTATGEPDLSALLIYLLIQKERPNYNRAVIEQRYRLVGETANYLLYKRK